jgi:hypothetical protein
MALIEINWKPDRQDLRKFGWICVVAFGGLGGWVWFRASLLGLELSEPVARALSSGLGFVAAASLLASWLVPHALRPLYLLLTLVSAPIGFVVSHVLMGAIFYGLFTPIGLFFKLRGRDALNRRFDRDTTSYWEPRKPATDSSRYFRQF